MKEQKIYRFRVLEGEHRERNRVFQKGEEFESPYPLDEMFVGKVLRMSDVVERYVPERKVQPDTRMMFVFADANEVTGSFPIAQEHKLRVFKSATGHYAVAAADMPDDELMNIAPNIFGGKKQVNEWLASYAESKA
jgi:hypothetical protein